MVLFMAPSNGHTGGRTSFASARWKNDPPRLPVQVRSVIPALPARRQQAEAQRAHLNRIGGRDAN
jgi:hypothetical protein